MSKREKLMAGQMDPPPEDEQAKEAWIQEYAKLLDEVKKTNPQKYQELVKQLQAQVQQQRGGSKIRMPGQNKVLGENGVEDVNQIDREEVVPEPGFVIKTKDLAAQKNGKVFINICSSTKLKKFKTVKKKAADGSVQEGLNIPLSCGPRKSEKDKQGTPCAVYDIIVHPNAVTEAVNDKTGNFRHWVCNFALQYIQQKHGVQVDFKYKLPRMKYKGDLSGGKKPSTQFIRKVGPTIEEVDTEEAGGNTRVKKSLKKKKKEKMTLEFAKYSMVCKYTDPDRPDISAADFGSDTISEAIVGTAFQDKDGKLDLPSHIELSVTFPSLLVRHQDKIEIEMSNELVVVSAPGYRRLEIFLPLPVQRDTVHAQFDGLGGGGELVISMDVNVERFKDLDDDGTRPDEGSRPWLLADAISGLATEKSNAVPGNDEEPVVEDDEEEEFPEDAFHRQDVMSMHYIAEKKKQQARMKQKQAEAEKERNAKIAKAKAGDKRYSLEGTDGSIITEVIGGDQDDGSGKGEYEDDSDNDMPSLPAGFPNANQEQQNDDDDDDDDDNFLTANTQFELLD